MYDLHTNVCLSLTSLGPPNYMKNTHPTTATAVDKPAFMKIAQMYELWERERDKMGPDLDVNRAHLSFQHSGIIKTLPVVRGSV